MVLCVDCSHCLEAPKDVAPDKTEKVENPTKDDKRKDTWTEAEDAEREAKTRKQKE